MLLYERTEPQSDLAPRLLSLHRPWDSAKAPILVSSASLASSTGARGPDDVLQGPNNVAFEASPLTTLIEVEVGLQLCEMLGYNRFEDVDEPLAWGHIASGGTVANLESMWYVFFTLRPRKII